MEVTVDYLGHVKRIIGIEQAEKIKLKNDVTVSDLLSFLAVKHGKSFREAIYDPNGQDLKPNYILTVNGLLLNQLNGLKTKLKDGDHVVVMPIVSGG